jgi:hypothetical protein
MVQLSLSQSFSVLVSKLAVSLQPASLLSHLSPPHQYSPGLPSAIILALVLPFILLLLLV